MICFLLCQMMKNLNFCSKMKTFVVLLPKPAKIFYYDEIVSYTVKKSVIFITYMYQVLSLDVHGDIALLCFV